MSRQHHNLKIKSEYYNAVKEEIKFFEIRKNDRDFKEFDMVTLYEVVKGELTGRELGPFQITYVFEGGKYGLKKGYCIFCWRY